MYTEIFNDDMLLRDCMYVCIFFLVPLLEELRVGALSTKIDFRGYPFFAVGGAFFRFSTLASPAPPGQAAGRPRREIAQIYLGCRHAALANTFFRLCQARVPAASPSFFLLVATFGSRACPLNLFVGLVFVGPKAARRSSAAL